MDWVGMVYAGHRSGSSVWRACFQHQHVRSLGIFSPQHFEPEKQSINLEIRIFPFCIASQVQAVSIETQSLCLRPAALISLPFRRTSGWESQHTRFTSLTLAWSAERHACSSEAAQDRISRGTFRRYCWLLVLLAAWANSRG